MEERNFLDAHANGSLRSSQKNQPCRFRLAPAVSIREGLDLTRADRVPSTFVGGTALMQRRYAGVFTRHDPHLAAFVRHYNRDPAQPNVRVSERERCSKRNASPHPDGRKQCTASWAKSFWIECVRSTTTRHDASRDNAQQRSTTRPQPLGARGRKARRTETTTLNFAGGFKSTSVPTSARQTRRALVQDGASHEAAPAVRQPVRSAHRRA